MSYRWLETTDKIAVTVPPGAAVLTQFYNFAGWLKPHTMGGSNQGTVFHHGSRPRLGFDGAAGSLKLRWDWLYTGNDAQWRAETTWPIDVWSHIFVSHDMRSNANKPKIYKNGVPLTVTTVAGPSGSPEQFNTNWIGNDGGNGRTWNGWMDDLAFWGGRLLTPEEALSIYLRGAKSVPRGKVLQYDMRLIVDGQAKDFSGNGRHGTITGLDLDMDNGFRGGCVGPLMIA